MRDIHVFLAIAVFGVLEWIPASAAVTSVSGVVSDGQKLVVRGEGFGVKPNGAAPYAYWDFSKGVSTTGSLSRTAHKAPALGGFAQEPRAANSATSWVFNVTSNGGEVYAGSGTSDLEPKPPFLYVHYKIMANWDGIDAYAARSDYNLKGFRFWSAREGTAGHKNNAYMLGIGQQNVASGGPRSSLEFTRSGGLYPGDSQSLAPKNTWKTQELLLKQSSAIGVADASFYSITNGVVSKQWFGEITRTAEYPGEYSRLYWHQVQASGFALSDGKYLAYDFVYVDDSWMRVVVTDRANWSDVGQAVEVQLPIAWTNSEITVVLRRGAFDSLVGKYLYVIDQGGRPVSAVGFKLRSTEEGPATPRGFTVD